MSDGEKMIWAAAFVAAINDDNPAAFDLAHDRVEDARRLLKRYKDRIKGRPALEMLREVIER